MNTTTYKYQAWVFSTLDVHSTDGREANVLCPLHGDTRPSLRFNMETGLWICHACQERGNFHSLLKQMGLAAVDATEGMISLGDQLTEFGKVVEELEDALEFREDIEPQGHPERWLKQFDNPHGYWVHRGLSPEMITATELGFDTALGAGTIPLRDRDGRILGVIRRFIDESMMKYQYPKGFQKSTYLYGEYQMKNRESQQIILVEGALDAIACWEVGLNACAVLGSSLSEEQGKILPRMGITTVITMMDNDAAGHRAADSVQAVVPDGIQVYIGLLKHGISDPMDAITRSKPEILHRAVLDAVPWIDWDNKHNKFASWGD